jgi:dTDP-4-dehydrorhamnose reductase
MRVLILGASGMLGHKLWQAFQHRFDTWGTVRSSYREYAKYDFFDAERLLGDVDACAFSTVERVLNAVQPNVVINAIGVVKQSFAAQDPVTSIEVNALFPHRLAGLCRATDARLIHISTDCVFSGRKGMYTEDDVPDAEDLYGRSKLLGEVASPASLTLRTSLIGRELASSRGLVEWFLSNRGGRVRGYTNAIFSGFPTIILADIIADVIQRHPHLSGVYHASSDPITKYQLLCLLRDAYQISIEIERYPDISVDRTLDSRRFHEATEYLRQPWPAMVRLIVNDQTPYESWRRAHVL